MWPLRAVQQRAPSKLLKCPTGSSSRWDNALISHSVLHEVRALSNMKSSSLASLPADRKCGGSFSSSLKKGSKHQMKFLLSMTPYRTSGTCSCLPDTPPTSSHWTLLCLLWVPVVHVWSWPLVKFVTVSTNSLGFSHLPAKCFPENSSDGNFTRLVK